MELKFIQKGEPVLMMHPAHIKEIPAPFDTIQVRDMRGKVLFGTKEYRDTEDNRQYLFSLYKEN
jgi:hypothetical protein